MSFKEQYTKGAGVWIPHPYDVWEGATVTQDYRTGVLIIQTDHDKSIKQIKINKDSDFPPLRNPSILVGQNDLTSLSYLNEPAVLYNLKVRFCERNAIYTYCGIVLVAINPYYDLPIYGDETIMAYRGQAMGDLDPHIFAVSEEAFTKLEREQRDQSIIVSGESGAGKTVSAKYAMRYFAAVGGNASETQVERKVLASSPIMEAVGNAKTTRNDNSSRFGKFIEIHFDKSYRISGASMRTYLLEKSRVVYQATGERNYHIFYQICAARQNFPQLALDHQDTFHYLNQGGNANIDNVDDAKTFLETKQALSTLGFAEWEQADMFMILAAILHLGNVDLHNGDPNAEAGKETEDGAYIDDDDSHLSHFCRLLGLPRPEVSRWLTHRRIASATEVIISRMDAERARAARDALAKRIYADVFAWAVKCVNRALETGGQTQHFIHHFIGVLDIYGFETFEINSFEQFCINYANEKLQQQFNSHVFKLEQEEYIKEGIDWQMIDFYDNQPCIKLIEERFGVLAMLDEECRVPGGSDHGFAAKLHDKCASSPHFLKPRFGDTTFIIKHFADDVEYQTGGFLDKNRDTVLEEQLEMVRGSSCGTLAIALGAEGAESGLGSSNTLPPPQKRKAKPNVPLHSMTQPPRRASSQKQTVGSQFRASLSALMATLSATTPHYVRCIKPNDDKKPFSYDSARAVQQLRACGVLETIRISAAGFPSRWLYQDFFHRYRLLCRSKDIDRQKLSVTCKKILEKNIRDPDKYQFGQNKIFFRAGQVAYLEKVRADLQRLYCVRVQSCVRGFIARRKYRRIMYALRGIQSHARGFLARRRANDIRRNRAAVVVQKHVRGWLARKTYSRLRCLVIGLQARARGYLARNQFEIARRNKAATVIQRNVRVWLSRLRWQKFRQQLIICQASVRRLIARRRYKQLRTEARSLEHVKKLNHGLENKIISLQQKLGEALNENKALKPLQHQISELKSKLEHLKQVENEVKNLKITLSDQNKEIDKLKEFNSEEKQKNINLLSDNAKLKQMYDSERATWNTEKIKYDEELKKSVWKYENEITENQKNHEAEKAKLMAELEAERSSRQKLLSTQYDLQEQIDTMQSSVPVASQRQHRRSLSDASNNSQQEIAVEDDFGYGSVRSTETVRPALEAVNWSAGTQQGQNVPIPMADAGLVLRLQRRLASLQSELSRTTNRARDLEDRLSIRSAAVPSAAPEDAFRLPELEMENAKLRDDLQRLRSAATAGDNATMTKEISEQLSAMEIELVRRREECIQLRSVLSNQTVNLKSLASSNYGSDVDIINEDGELAQAFEAQKKITRQLEDELTSEKKFYTQSIVEYKAEIEKLRDDNERQQRLLSGPLSQDPKSQAEQFSQNEIVRLAAENLALQERIDTLSESCRRYKNQIRMLADRLKDAGVEDVQDILEGPVLPTRNTAVVRSTAEVLPTVRKKEREYLGMFEYRKQDEGKIMQKLVTDLKPSVAVTLLPGLPAYIVFMMLRHMDHIDDEPKMHGLMKAVHTSIKKIVKKRSSSIEYTSLWLANMLRLLNILRQYSGDQMYQTANTERQNQQCLRLFDLSEYRQVMSDNAIWIYQGLIALLERQLDSLIVPAILEYEEISGLLNTGAGKPQTNSPSSGGPNKLTAELVQIHKTLGYYGVDNHMIIMVFRQLLYFVCAHSLNQLLLRKDLCCWTKGLQIRYNISHLEVWAKENLNEYGQKNVEEVLSTLKPITQAVQLLQARKSMDDVQSTVDMCKDLTAMQVCKILNLYTAAEEYELKITREFIHEIQHKMQLRAGNKTDKEQPQLLMDSKYVFSVEFPFNPSPVRIEDIELPEVLGLADLLVKV